MKVANVSYFATLLSVLTAFGHCAIPDFIHVCRHDDPDFGDCIKESVQTLKPLLKTGIPEIEVPSIEPLTLDHLSFATSSESTHLKTNLTNIKIFGISDFNIIKIVPTQKKNGYNFRFEILVPQLHLKGEYEIDTKLLLLQVQGKGPFNANATDYHFECILKGNKMSRDGVNHLEFQEVKCNSVIGKIRIFLENLFNGNPVLGKATNDAINENSHGFFNEIKPGLIRAVRAKLIEIANKITLHFSYEELFP